MAALLFAIHPIQSEPVAYVVARGTLLATLFCVLTLRAWKRDQTSLAILCFATALLSKVECITFPLLLLLLGRWRWKPVAAMLGMSVLVGLHSAYATALVDSGRGGLHSGNLAGPIPWESGLRHPSLFPFIRGPWGFTIDPRSKRPPGTVSCLGSCYRRRSLP